MCRKLPKIISFRDIILSQSHPGKIICFQNCRLFRNANFSCQNSVDSCQELWIRDGIVLEPQQIFYDERRRPDLLVDCEGLVLAPGFVDIQVNGAFGVDFTSLAGGMAEKDAHEKLAEVAENILQYGVTSFCPTIITACPDSYKMFLKLLSNYNPGGKNFAQILGAHFEGPFISPNKLGCHPKSFVIPSLLDSGLDEVYGTELDRLAYVTIAPELPGATKAIGHLCAKSIKVAMGHTNATHTEAKRAIDAGATSVTHLLNAMRQFGSRDPGILGLLTTASEKKPIYSGIIADGVHVADLAILLAFCANPCGTILVTDCIAALGLGDGVHALGDMSVQVEGNLSKIIGTDLLAGSVSSMPHCIRHFANVLDRNKNSLNGLAEALKAATLNPAKFLGIADQIGTLKAGSKADFVLIDEQANVFATFIEGTKRFQVQSN